MPIGIAFDVLGTCFSLDLAVKAVKEIFGDQLEAKKVNAEQLIDDLFHSAQRDFTYLSMNDSYTPIGKCIASNLPRILLMAGIQPPSSGTITPTSTFTSPFSSECLAPIMATLSCMTPRPSLAAASELLVSTGKFNLLAATNGGEVNTRRLYDLGLGLEMSKNWGVFSCDTDGIAKPDPKVYKAILDRLGRDEGNNKWFMASHSWDLQAAKKAGFKTAWVAYEEVITCEDINGRPDIVAVDLLDAAKQIIAWEERSL